MKDVAVLTLVGVVIFLGIAFVAEWLKVLNEQSRREKLEKQLEDNYQRIKDSYQKELRNIFSKAFQLFIELIIKKGGRKGENLFDQGFGLGRVLQKKVDYFNDHNDILIADFPIRILNELANFCEKESYLAEKINKFSKMVMSHPKITSKEIRVGEIDELLDYKSRTIAKIAELDLFVIKLQEETKQK